MNHSYSLLTTKCRNPCHGAGWQLSPCENCHFLHRVILGPTVSPFGKCFHWEMYPILALHGIMTLSNGWKIISDCRNQSLPLMKCKNQTTKFIFRIVTCTTKLRLCSYLATGIFFWNAGGLTLMSDHHLHPLSHIFLSNE